MVANFTKKQKNNPKKRLLLYIGAILAMLIFGVLVIGNIRMYHKKQEFLTQAESLKKQIKDIEDRNNNLKQGISKTDDSQYIEKAAREELDLQKPGEKAVSFVMPENESQDGNGAKQNTVGGWFNMIWNWIRGKNR